MWAASASCGCSGSFPAPSRRSPRRLFQSRRRQCRPSRPRLPGKPQSRDPSCKPVPPAQQADLLPAERVRSADDLSWIGRLRNLPRNKEAVMLASLRYFGRQSYKYAALQLGMTVAALRSFYDRIDLPRDYDRSKFGAAV